MLRTAWALRMSRRTPPTSDLWVMSGELIFMATGKPSDSAATSASFALRAWMVCTTGIRKAASTALDSSGVSTLRRSESTPSMMSRAPSTSGWS